MMAQLRSFPTSCCCSKKLFAAISIPMSSNNVDAADVCLMTDIEVPVWPLQLPAPSFLNFFCKERISVFLLSSSSQFSSATPIFFFYNSTVSSATPPPTFSSTTVSEESLFFWSKLTNPKLPKCNSHNTHNSLQSKFLQKNPNVSLCLSVCVLCNKTKGRGRRKKKKKKNLFLTNKMSVLCPLLHTKQKNLSLQQRAAKKKKIKTRQWVLDFFLSSSRSLCNLQTH